MRNAPQVSVIIPCHNHGRYLPQALDSVLRQSLAPAEIIVVDDGSTDNTRQVAQGYPGVRYHYQPNQGLPAARNTGVSLSTGEYLVFLDADDYLYPDALATNLAYLRRQQQLAFVSGSHDKVHTATGVVQPVVKTVPSDHYRHLLKGNYIGMHAAVMYSRWVFDRFRFDPALKACEDYDLYLKITRKHPVLHHESRIAAYCLHQANMSGNLPLMLRTALRVLRRQQRLLLGQDEAAAYAEGRRFWKRFYLEEMAARLELKHRVTWQEYAALLRYQPRATLGHLLRRGAFALTCRVARLVPSGRGRKKLRALFSPPPPAPAPGKVRLGDFNRPGPFSTQFGYDRGGPVDRYYIENFLSQSAPLVRGRVLEIGDNAYTLLYGGQRVTRSDILHVDASNPRATWVGDISHAPHLPDNTFDCIIMTQTLHLVYHVREALQTCFRILRPGGTLLLTVPGITPIDHGEWEETWYWSFTDKAMRRLMEEAFPDSAIEVYPFGNVFTATAFLYGMGLPEVPPARLVQDDPHFQVIVTVKATKAPAR